MLLRHTHNYPRHWKENDTIILVWEISSWMNVYRGNFSLSTTEPNTSEVILLLSFWQKPISFPSSYLQQINKDDK